MVDGPAAVRAEGVAERLPRLIGTSGSWPGAERGPNAARGVHLGVTRSLRCRECAVLQRRQRLLRRGRIGWPEIRACLQPDPAIAKRHPRGSLLSLSNVAASRRLCPLAAGA